MLRIIDRYVLKECAFATIAVVAVLLFILLGNTFVRVLGNIADGKLSADSLLPMLGINMIHYLVILVPMGLYLGILLGMGRLYRDSEMAALFACGIGMRQLYRPVNYLAIAITMLSVLLVFYLGPWAATVQDELKHRAQNQSQLAGLLAGQFNKSGDGSQTLFFEGFAQHSIMQKPFLYSTDGEVPLVQLAETGRQLRQQNGDPYLIFMQGRSYSGIPGQANYRIIEFSNYGVRVHEKEPSAVVASRIGALPTSVLLSHEDTVHIAELHWRLAVPIACFVLALMALPLSHTAPRKGRFAQLGIGMLIYLVYSNFIGLGKAWLERELLPLWVGLWWVHLIFVVVVILLVLWREQAGLFSRRNSGGITA